MPTFPLGLEQPAGAMRFSADSLLLPAFVASSLERQPLKLRNPLREQAFGLPPGRAPAVADLGCGCGASALALLLLVPQLRVWGVDISEELVASAGRNAAAFGCADRTRFDRRDVAELAGISRPFCDMIQINPPYWDEGDGLVSPRSLNEQARRGSAVLAAFLAAARQLLVFHGRLFLIYPAARLVPLLEQVSGCGFGVRRMRAIRPSAHRPAIRVLLEARRQAAHDVVWEPDLVLHGEDGMVTEQARAFCPWLR